jgi:TP901 family phage tail tape measure protein
VDIGTIEAALKLRDEASPVIARFNKNLGGMATTGREVGESMSRLGLAITAGVVVPLGLIIKTAKDFEQAFSNVVKTVGDFDVDAFGNLTEDAQAFREEILNLSREIPVAASELANIAAIGGQFGVAKDDLLGFTETVAKLGVAVDGIEAETAAAAIAQIANVTREGSQAFEQYASVLVELGNKGNSTEGEILEFAKRLSGAGTQAGLTGAEIFGLGSAMANVGLNAEAGGTAMSRLLSQMSRAGAEGAEASQKFADFAGRVDATVKSGEAFAQLFEQNASKALQLFFDGLSDAANSGENLNVILTDLGVNEVRQRDTTIRLAGAQGELAKQFSLAREEAVKMTALNEEARKKFSTFDAELQKFKNTVALVAIEIGTPLLRALQGALQGMKPLTDGLVVLARGFADLPKVVQAAALALGGGVGLTGVLILLGGQAVRAASDIARLAQAIKGLAFTQVAADIGKAASNVTALGGAVSTATGSMTGFSKATSTFGFTFQTAAPAIAATTTEVGLLGRAATALGGLLSAKALGIAALVAAAAAAKYALDKFTEGMGAMGGVIRTLAQPTSFLTEIVKGMIELFRRAQPILADVGTILKDHISTGFQIARAEAKPFLDALVRMATDARTFASALAEKVNTGLTVFVAIVRQVVPGVEQLATAVAFVTGKSGEWAAELKAQADRIREAQGLLPKHTADIKLLAEEQAKGGKASGEAADKLAQSREELTRLTAAVRALNPEQRSLIDGWRAAGLAAEDIAKKTHIAEGTVTAYIKASDAAAAASTKLAKETAIASDAFAEVAKEGVGAVEKLLELSGALDAAAKFDEQEKAVAELTKRFRELTDAMDIRQRTQGLSAGFAAAIKLTRAFSNEIDDLRQEAKDADPALAGMYEQLELLKRVNFAEELEEAVVTTDEFRMVLLAVNPSLAEMLRLAEDTTATQGKATEKTKDWTLALKDISTALSNLKELGGGIGFAAEFVAQADVALQSFGKVREGIKEFAKGAKADLTAAFASMASGIASGFAGLLGATGPDNSLSERLLGGALQGASLGASVGATIGATIATSAANGAAVGGVWGAAAGVIVGLMVAVFRGRKARREMEIVGAEWGTSISQGLYKQIAVDQKELFGGDRGTAALFNFSDILKEAGGLNDLNFDQFTKRLRDVFVALETGAFTTEQALQVMEDNFDAFAKHVIESGEFASKEFLEILNLNMASGLNSPEIQDFINNRSQAIGGGLAAMLGPVLEGASKIGDRVRKAFEVVDDLIKGGKQGTSDYTQAVGELNAALAHQREVAAGAIGDLENIGVIALSTFTRARASGLSFIEALNAIGPSLDALIQAQRDLGIEGTNSAINQLMHYRELANQFPVLVAAASALAPTLLAIQQSGGLTTEALAAMEDQGMRTFHRLRDAGFTEAEALAQIADFLKQVEKAHKQLGTPIDENTQRMIDQARAAGLMGDEAVSATEQQRRGFEMVTKAINQLIVTLGGVPVAIDDISKALDDIPKDVEINVDLKMPDHLPELPPGPVYFPPGQRVPTPELPEPPAWGEWSDDAMRAAGELDEAFADQGDTAVAAAEGAGRAYRNLAAPISESTNQIMAQADEAVRTGDVTLASTEAQARGFEMVTQSVRQTITELNAVPDSIEAIRAAMATLPGDVQIGVTVEQPVLPQIAYPEVPTIPSPDLPEDFGKWLNENTQTVERLSDDLDEQGEVATSAASDMTRAYRNVGEPIDANTQLVIDQAREVIAMGADTAEATAEQSRGFEMVTSAIGDLIVALDGVPTRIEQIGEAIRQHLPTDIIIPIDFELPDGPQYFPEPPVIEEAPFPQFPQGPYYPGPMGPGGFTPEDVDAAMRAGAQRTDNGMIYIEVPVEIDGEAVTRVVARRLPEHTELYGGPSARTTI